MRLGYVISDGSFNLTNYQSYPNCSDEKIMPAAYIMQFYRTLTPKEVITCFPFAMFSPTNWSAPFADASLLGALGSGIVDVFAGAPVITRKRFEILAYRNCSNLFRKQHRAMNTKGIWEIAPTMANAARAAFPTT